MSVYKNNQSKAYPPNWKDDFNYLNNDIIINYENDLHHFCDHWLVNGLIWFFVTLAKMESIILTCGKV